MRYKLDVVPFKVGYGKKAVDGGYHIAGVFSEGGTDDMWDYLDHPAVFKDKARAEAFLERVRKGEMNLNHWRMPSNVTAAVQMKEEEKPLYYCPFN